MQGRSMGRRVFIAAVLMMGATLAQAGVPVQAADPEHGNTCREVPLLEPARFATLADSRTTLRWQPQGAGPYRVQVVVQVPESHIVATYDAQVAATQWTLPADLPVERAAVKVLVSQSCASFNTQDLHARSAWFFLDQRAACAINAASLRIEAGRLHWQAMPQAQSYRVRLLRPPVAPQDAWELVQAAQSDASAWMLPTGHRQGDVVTVQPACGERLGRPAAWPLS